MALLEIRHYPDKFLRQTTEPVERVDDAIQTIIDDMAETMYANSGAGLAAIQVGINKSIIVYDIAPRDEGRDLRVIINPRIVNAEGTLLSENEGCLSVPEFRADVRRNAKVRVEALDREGNPLVIEDEGYHAIVLQHEIDHLSGVLFIDRISSLKRQLYKRRVKKNLRSRRA